MTALPTKAKLMAWVEDYAERVGLDAARTLFLTKFASWAGVDFESGVKVDTLTRQSRCSKRMLQKMRAEFVAARVLVPSGRCLTIEDSKGKREVPLYRWAMFLAEFGAEVGAEVEGSASGAPCAPERAAGVHRTTASGAQGVHPQIEPIEPTPSDEGDARARQTAFERLEEAFPKRGLGFTNRGRAIGAFWTLWDERIEVEDLIRAAKAYAEDRKGKTAEQGLDYWLVDRKYRGWWPDTQLGLGEPVASAPATPHCAPEVDLVIWRKVEARLLDALTESTFGSWLKPARFAERAGGLYLVAFSGTARDWIRNNCWRRVTAWWAEADAAGRQLTLVSKNEFEALARQTEGVG